MEYIQNRHIIDNFERLMPESTFTKKIVEDFDQIDYFVSKENVLNLVDEGYKILPSVYHKSFLDPLKGIILNYYEELLGFVSRNKNDDGSIPGPYRDWLDSIYQHKTGYMKKYSKAFEEYCSDIYDGFLSNEERVGVKPPDYQKVSPLIRWGGEGPYTYPANGPTVSTSSSYLINMGIVCMPISYSKNIMYWIANGHEAAGHDILHADDGLLNEIEDKIIKEIDEDETLKAVTINYNNRNIPFSEFAKWYWRYTMDETASDVLGSLNLGPAFGIGLALLFSSPNKFTDKPLLRTRRPIEDLHPIQSLRVLLAAETIKNIPELDNEIANNWADFLETIAYKYIENKENFELYVTNRVTKTQKTVVTIPHDILKKTLPILAKTIAFSPLKQIENHSFNEINTWSTSDEFLTQEIAENIINDKELPIKDPVYPAHIISGAIMALINSSKLDLISVTEKAISALNKIYDNNHVFRGLPFNYKSDIYTRDLSY